MEKEIKVPSGFFLGLLKNDDWSFVIKLHSVIEATITFLLVKEAGKHELQDVFSELPLSDRKKGKIAFVRALNLLDKEYCTFIGSLSEIRNDFVHDISQVGATLQGYTAKLLPNEKTKLLKAISLGDKEPVDFGEKKVPRMEFIEQNLRVSIWLACMIIIYAVYGKATLVHWETAAFLQGAGRAAMGYADAMKDKEQAP